VWVEPSLLLLVLSSGQTLRFRQIQTRSSQEPSGKTKCVFGIALSWAMQTKFSPRVFYIYMFTSRLRPNLMKFESVVALQVFLFQILREFESLRKEFEKDKKNVCECKLYMVSLTAALEKLEQRVCSAVLKMHLTVSPID